MNQKSVWIVLIVAALVCSASIRPGEAKDETTLASVWQQFKELSARTITGFEKTVSGITAVLTASKLKDRKDICVWKICSRPLKKTNGVSGEKPSEVGHKLSDAELMAILKTLNSRRMGI